jgi:hypothetical protein
MDIHAGFLSEALVEQVVLRQGNATMNVSVVGLRNAMVGFNNFVKIKHEMLREHVAEGETQEAQKDISNITTLLLSFIKMDAIVCNRYKRNESQYVRLSDADFNRVTGADSSRKVKEHMKELHEYIARFTSEMDKRTESQFDLANTWKVISNPQMTEANGKAATEAMLDFRRRIEGACSRLSQKELSDLMMGIQYGTGNETPLVRGILGQKKKTKADEVEAKSYAFTSPFDEPIKRNVAEVVQLRQKLATKEPKKTVEEINAQREARIEELIRAVEQGRSVGGPEDIDLLNNEINRLNTELEGGGNGGEVKQAA